MAWKQIEDTYVVDVKKGQMVDGPGVRTSIFVSYCPFNCKGCFNEKIQRRCLGTPYTEEIEEEIIESLRVPYVNGLTLLGGEPYLNSKTLSKLCERVREEFGDTKTIWSYSGFTFEELLEEAEEVPSIKKMLNLCDVLVDGRFVLEMRDEAKMKDYPFRGSMNQRLIDLPASLKNKEAVLWDWKTR